MLEMMCVLFSSAYGSDQVEIVDKIVVRQKGYVRIVEGAHAMPSSA